MSKVSTYMLDKGEMVKGFATFIRDEKSKRFQTRTYTSDGPYKTRMGVKIVKLSKLIDMDDLEVTNTLRISHTGV